MTREVGGRAAVIYARVSSKEQETEGFSIPAQIKFLHDYAISHSFVVAREFTDSETAKCSGRPAFNEMLTFLRRSTCRVILVEKTDRLYRNFRDMVTVEDLDVEVHVVKEHAILSRNSGSQDKLIHGFFALLAKNYTDNLSEEVRKGMHEKAEQGHWPSWAPLGYRNNLEIHRIEPHPVEGPLVVRLFEDAADNRMTLDKLSRAAFQRGLRSRQTQRRLTVEAVRRLLKNPLYWGPFRWGGKLYQGSHTPLVSKQLFDDVQLALHARNKPRRQKHSFAFNGMVSCQCGKRLTGQIVKGRYRYYGCSTRCGTPLIKESILSGLFLAHLEAVRVDEKVAESILTAIKEFEVQRQSERKQALARHQAQQREVQRRIDAAYDDKIAGRVTEEYWLRRFNEWQEELATIRAAIRDLENATFDSFKTADKLIALCRRAPELFARQTHDEQARLISFVESNSRWDGVTLTAVYRQPFDLLAEGLNIKHGGAYRYLKTNSERFARNLEGLQEALPGDLYRELAVA